MPEKKILDIMEKVYQEQKIKRDSLFEEAIGIISKQKTCKPAILQNRLAVGYHRACQILEQMETDGIVGPESKTGEREVLMKNTKNLKKKVCESAAVHVSHFRKYFFETEKCYYL